MSPHSGVQLPLRFPDAPGLTSAPGREEPALWIRRVAIWHDVTNPPKRDFPLKRGLNIVYSPPGDDPEGVATGHAAGKTMLCRLIRYGLGEESFADPDDASVIRHRFPRGAVGIEVRVRNQTWIVRRAFASGEHVAFRGESLEELSSRSPEDPFTAFLDALHEIGLDNEQRKLLAGIDDLGDAWQFILAWLTRDQECRIDGLLHWRHKDSSSAASVRTSGDQTRLTVLRVALGLYSKGASELRTKIADATARCDGRDGLRVRVRQAEQRFEGVRYELARALRVDVERIWPPPESEEALQQDEVTRRDVHRVALMALADKRIRETSTVPTDANAATDDAQLETDAATLAGIAQQIETLKTTVDHQNETAKLLELEHAGHEGAVRAAKHPSCPYDDAPLDVERARFVCPLPRLPDPAAPLKLAAATALARKEHARELEKSGTKLAELVGQQASLTEKVAATRRRIEARQLAVAAATKASQSAWATKGLVGRLFDLRAEADKAREAETEARTKLTELQEQQKSGLSAFHTTNLQRWFDYLIRRILSPEAEGFVVLDGNGLHPRIHWHGRRRSVALNSLKIVLFDLAAMLCAVEGDGIAPAFLIHDSPREGDLDPFTYARIFSALRELGPDDQSAAFQYIVTTTTTPPPHVADRIQLTISADRAENRLLMEDL